MKTPQGMVERVARAICEASGDTWDDDFTGPANMERAQAAIEAMHPDGITLDDLDGLHEAADHLAEAGADTYAAAVSHVACVLDPR